MMKYTVVIPVYQAAATVAAVIAAWQSAGTELILVIDDGSTDETAEIAERSGARVVRCAENCGRGAARDRGMRETDTPLVLMCDSAQSPSEDFVTRALTHFSDARVAAVFARNVQPPPRSCAERWRGRHLFKLGQPAAFNRRAHLSTGLCVLRREAVEQVGGFDPRFRAGEDADLGQRLLDAGWEVIADPALQALCLQRDSAHSVLKRYARWNSPHGIRGRAWLRQLAYAVKVMARDDLRAGDPLCALLSLAAPFYQLRAR
ncbi:MAG TPA: glycosyltransferase [Chthoniobacter sp.]|nr:glycosyltransferase [Chthoniobacter sp.]